MEWGFPGLAGSRTSQNYYCQESHRAYAELVKNKLREAKIRVSIDNNDENLGTKVRSAISAKIPYVVVVGDKEVQNSNISVRCRGKDSQESFGIPAFIESIENAVTSNI